MRYYIVSYNLPSCIFSGIFSGSGGSFVFYSGVSFWDRHKKLDIWYDYMSTYPGSEINSYSRVSRKEYESLVRRAKEQRKDNEK